MKLELLRPQLTPTNASDYDEAYIVCEKSSWSGGETVWSAFSSTDLIDACSSHRAFSRFADVNFTGQNDDWSLDQAISFLNRDLGATIYKRGSEANISSLSAKVLEHMLDLGWVTYREDGEN